MQDAPTPVTFSGVAATGAPMSGAAVVVTDAAGATVCATTAAENGSYSCTLAANSRPPFAVSARLEEKQLFSVAASAQSGTVNVTPLTSLIVARLVPDGNPANLAAAIHANPAVASVDNVQAQVAVVSGLIAPVAAAVGDTTNPIRGAFNADGNGHDKVLDALQVSIRPTTGASNIEVTVKVRPDSDAAAPVNLTFRSNETAPAPLAASIRADDLVENGIAGQINGFMGRATACYAEPLTQRIAGVAPGATQATGGPSIVNAPACRGLFIDDDPATYFDNGARVGSATGSHFRGMFNDSSTGARFDKANFEFQWANGDVFITYGSTSRSGTIGSHSLTLRKQGGQFKAVGNQYRYEASIRPFAAEREFPLQPQFTWLGSGYSPWIRNATDLATGLPLFREAHVTAPDGRQSLYRPLSGRSGLAVVEAGGRQRVNTVQFHAGVYKTDSTAGHPREKDGSSGSFFTDVQLSDAQILELPDHGVWTFRWVHADSSQPDVVQTYRTLRRAPTIGELRQIKFVELSAAFKAELLARDDVNNVAAFVFGAPSAVQPNVFSFATASGSDGWTVPDGALAPKEVSIYGWLPGVSSSSFSDTLGVGAADRKADVSCTTQSVGDLHCDTSTDVRQFAAGARVESLELWTVNSRQLSLQRQVNLYRVPD